MAMKEDAACRKTSTNEALAIDLGSYVDELKCKACHTNTDLETLCVTGGGTTTMTTRGFTAGESQEKDKLKSVHHHRRRRRRRRHHHHHHHHDVKA
jgi:hypothetical protein